MTLLCRLLIDGQRVADGSDSTEPADEPYALEGLTVTWGRATTVDQPAPSSASFSIYARQDWADSALFAEDFRLGRRVDLDVGELDRFGAFTQRGRVFTGVVTDVSMVVPDDQPTFGLLLSVTADDLLADLGNRPAGASPWPAETVAARFAHVLSAARLSTGYLIASDLAGIMVRHTDADSKDAAALLGDLAISTDGVLWSISQLSEPMLWLESPALRAPLRRLAWVPPWVVIVDVSVAADALNLDTCVPDIEPLEWRQTMSDLATGTTVTYYTPDPADPTNAGADIGTVVTTIAPGAESPDKPWGVRRIDVDSQLTTGTDASLLGTKLLARLWPASWRLNNLSVRNSDLADADMLRLLDSQSRSGLPVTISPMPSWAPPVNSDRFAGYLEGGEIEFSVGQFSVILWVSLAQGYAGASARYIDLPQSDTNWQFQDAKPSIRYIDLVGVGGPV